LAGRRDRGHRRAAHPCRCRDRRTGPAVSHGKAEDDPDQGAKECADGDQELAMTA
jgi:hypothetical protein